MGFPGCKKSIESEGYWKLKSKYCKETGLFRKGWREDT